MEEYNSGDEFYDLWVLLRRTVHTINKARQRELRQIGISPAEAAVLMLVHYKNNMITPSEISRFLIQEPHAVSSLLGRMEKHGLVCKIRDLGRKNWVRIALTDEGKEACEKSIKCRESIKIVMSVISGQERQQLKSHLEKLLNVALDESKKRHPYFGK